MDKENSKFVSFNFKLKSSAYAFLLPFLFIAIRYCHDEVFHLNKPEESLKILRYNLPYLFYLFLPKLFSFIFILIIKSNTKGETNSLTENIIVKNYHIAVEKRNKIRSFFLIYIISLLESLHEDISSLLYYYEIYTPEGGEKYIKGWLIEKKSCFIIFVPIFIYLIFNIEIHRHHYLALLFGYFGSIFINVSRFFLEWSYKEDYPFHLINVLLSLIYSLSLVLIKYIMIKYVLLSPYIFLLYDGIFNIINSILLILLQYIIVINLPFEYNNTNYDKTNSDENDDYFNNNFLQIINIFIGQKWKFYLYFFLSFIFSFFYYIFYTLALFNNSPFVIILIEAFLPLDSDIIEIILGSDKEYIVKDKNKILKRFYYQSIGYLFLFFGSLILNEIIVFNCCGLNDFTSSKMRERAKSEVNDCPPLDLINSDDNSYVEEKEE
mgnify:CR=1 FL=1